MSTPHGLPEFTFDLGDLPEQPEAVQEETVVEEDQPQETPETIDNDEPVEVETPRVEEEEEALPEDIQNYKSLLGFYKDEGLINYDGEITSKEQFADILRQQRLAEQEAVADALIEAVPEYAQGLMEYLLTEGDSLTMDKIKSFLDIAESGTKDINVEDESTAKQYLKEKFSKIHGEQMASTFIEALEDNGNLISTAQTELEKEKSEAANTQKAKIAESKAEKQAREEQQKVFQQTLVNELKSTGWKAEVQNETLNEIFSGNLRAKTSTIVNHPKALAKLANYMRFFDPKTGDIDEKAFANTAFSSAAKKLKDNIDAHFSRSGAFGGGSGGTEKRTSNKDVQYEFVD